MEQVWAYTKWSHLWINVCIVAVLLDSRSLLSTGSEDRAKLRCAPWAKHGASKQLQLALALEVLTQPAMTVGARVSGRLKVALYLQIDHAQKALQAKRHVLGVC